MRGKNDMFTSSAFDTGATEPYSTILELSNLLANERNLVFPPILSLNKNKLDRFEVLNIGGGKSTTVLELLKSFEETSGVKIKYKYMPRREGDLADFWADSSKAFEKLSWKTKRSIKNICEDTWRWHELNPTGYKRK